MKTKPYEKPISAELAALIKKAIAYTKEKYGDTTYIFVDEKNPSRPMPYTTVQFRITDMIYKKELRDDNGEIFGFGTHIYRHYYGMKLTEMHLDDWTIAKLLGHSSVRNVKYYRKMSNQLLADETRKARQRLSAVILDNLDGWEAEYLVPSWTFFGHYKLIDFWPDGEGHHGTEAILIVNALDGSIIDPDRGF